MNKETSILLLIFFCISLISAIWVFFDAKKREKNLGAAFRWALGTLLILYLFLPYWLIHRPELDYSQKVEQTGFIRKHWEGKASLISAFWIIGVIGWFTCRLIVGLVYLYSTSVYLYAFGGIAFFLFHVFALISIWRCAFNTNWKGWAYIARTIVILAFLNLSKNFYFAIQRQF